MRASWSLIGIVLAACSASGSNSGNGGSGGAGATSGAGGSAGNATGGSGGSIVVDGGLDSGGGNSGQDPTTCAEAAATASYVGCDFWAATVANNVWSIFDFTVIVANAGTAPAHIKVSRNGGTVTGTVQPNGLYKFYLPWVPQVKGPDTGTCGLETGLTASVHAKNAAYHVTSDVPVTVYQFNALEYKPAGGPPGKDWSSCPGYQMCTTGVPHKVGCFSYSNDASLLLPTTALTGDYRVTGLVGEQTGLAKGNGAYVAIVGTADGTTVTVKVSATGDIMAGAGAGADAGTDAGADLQATPAGGTATFEVDAGDVVELASTFKADLSGSLVKADKPVEVIAGMPCVEIPTGADACDHVEESVFPAQTLGKHYFVVPPTGPLGNVPGQQVKMVGNVDGTTLTYAGFKPGQAPTTLNAGQVVNLGIVKQAFEVEGNHEFGVETFMQGGSIVDPNGGEGDPSMSVATSVEQYRKKYVFLAPTDYDINYIDIVVPSGEKAALDGQAIATPTPISSGFGVSRNHLGAGANGAHVLVGDKPLGIQVLGYGQYTSYQYPGGSNLIHIAPPPPK
jgi:IgGFc binding protein